MRSSFKRRFLAYLIDIFIVFIISYCFKKIFVDNTVLNELNNNYNQINSLLFNHKISLIDYFLNFSKITQRIDQEMFLVNISNLIMIVIIFIIIPYFNKGQTIGKKLLKIRVNSLDNSRITLIDYIYRSFIINGLGYTIISLLFVYLIPDVFYLITVSFLGIFQFLLVFMSVFMISYKKDKRGIQDIITNTEVIKI